MYVAAEVYGMPWADSAILSKPGIVALVELIQAICVTTAVLVFGLKTTCPETSQSPAVRDMDVIFVSVAVVKAIGDACATLAEMYSPTLPALALLFVVVPMMPSVCEVVSEPAKTVLRFDLNLAASLNELAVEV